MGLYGHDAMASGTYPVAQGHQTAGCLVPHYVLVDKPRDCSGLQGIDSLR